MTVPSNQVVLSQNSIANFYHDLFVKSQVEDFESICMQYAAGDGVVCDMGGGCGYFSAALRERFGLPVRVVDSDPISVQKASEACLDAVLGDALEWEPVGDESIVCFNLILHHLVGRSDRETLRLQSRALEKWSETAVRIFVNEYIYDSYVSSLSGRLIYMVTSSQLLSSMASAVSRFIPSLRANTFGVGVRFRSEDEWRLVFQSLGWRVVAHKRGREEFVSLPRRMLLIKSCRRDSFVLTRSC